MRITTLARAYYHQAERAARKTQQGAVEQLARVQRDAGRARFCGMVGKSLAMQQLFEELTIAAQSRATVLPVGESGIGKEMAARAIQRCRGMTSATLFPSTARLCPTI